MQTLPEGYQQIRLHRKTSPLPPEEMAGFGTIPPMQNTPHENKKGMIGGAYFLGVI